ncbi:MAG TPA: CoA-acylating methylmalonate-semialdehyde dehydrogenase [Alphaproteobacteria bacterium]|nr:CoA-acylating methylmalonate-semialdehyde dehydrogenase [Alphaproteobacteria bacterium]
MSKYISHFINGKLVEGSKNSMSGVFNPATGEEISKVFLATSKEVDQAVAAATAAWPTWSATPALQRSRVLFRFKTILEANLDKLAAVVSEEHGKTISDAKGSCMRGLEVVEFACGIPHLLKGEFSENIGKGIDSWSTRQALGVCAGITPFNFPVMIALWMFPLSIACGNCFILKPSERDPSAALLLAGWMKEAGLPDGVLNVVQGDKNTVDLLLGHPGIAAISFVGSTTVAQHIYTKASSNFKRVQALGGAKNHMLVMPDADLDMTTDSLIGAAYGSAGERCMAISVVVAVDKVADKLVEKLAPRIRSLKIGPGNDPEVEMGPLISKQHLSKVENYVETGIKEGAKLVVDGRSLRLQGYENGYFMGGCLFDHVQPSMRIYQEEIFGPVLAVVRVPNYESAVNLINNHPYGNGTAIFTRDGDAARDFSSRIKVGLVGVNVPIPVPMAFHSFGGWKQSLYGDHHMHGMEGVRFYTKLKTITGRWPTGSRQGVEFNIPTVK